MEYIAVIIFVVLMVVNVSKKSKKKGNKETPVPNRPREASSVPNRSRSIQPIPNRPRPAANVGNRAKQAASDWARNLYEADRDRNDEYDHASLDYCDSDVPASSGISFRDLPSGSDELAYLRKWNANRERMLQKSLESRD